MARVLAFDYGLRRIGLAVTDPLQIIASSLETVETKTIDTFLKNYLSKEAVETFVIGYPVNFGHDKENEVLRHIDHFILELNRLYPSIKIVKIDERFTSKMAAQTLLMSGVNKKQRQQKGTIDKISATIILQTFLEMK